MPPSVLLRNPQKGFALIKPIPSTIAVIVINGGKNINPGSVFFCMNAIGLASGSIGHMQNAFILFPVELLDNHLILPGPFHPWDIMLTLITRNIHPGLFTGGKVNDTNPDSRGSLADFGIFNGYGLGINIRCIVHHHEILGTSGIHLPEGDLFSIGTPTKTIAAGKFLFIHPVKCPIDHAAVAIRCQCLDGSGFQVFDIDVLFRDKCRFLPVRGKFGKHQGLCRP